MKYIFFVFTLLVSTACFGQVDSKSLFGDWVYSDLTIEQGNAAVEDFSLNISADSTFTMTTATYSINGFWELKDSVLVLDGKRPDKINRRVEELAIHSLSEDAISFTMNLRAEDKVLMNLVRKD